MKGKVEPAPIRFGRLIDIDITGCWLWQGWINNWGYGQFGFGHQKTGLAHRWSYEQFIGSIPDGHEVDHLCRVRHCVNPAHLEAVTKRENTLRGTSVSAINARKTHCIHGHEYTDANTYQPRRGGRNCRTCAHERYIRKRAYQPATPTRGSTA